MGMGCMGETGILTENLWMVGQVMIKSNASRKGVAIAQQGTLG